MHLEKSKENHRIIKLITQQIALKIKKLLGK